LFNSIPVRRGTRHDEQKFANPYIIYYPGVSRDGMPFPVNRTVRDMQEEVNRGRRLREEQLWRGNLVAAKFDDDHFTQMMDASMADFPILKNFLRHPYLSQQQWQQRQRRQW